MKEVPILEKTNLSSEEAAAYCGIGTKRLIKRRRLDAYPENAYSI